MALITFPHIAPSLKKEKVVPLLSLCAFVAFSRVNSTFTFYRILLTTDFAKVPVTFWSSHMRGDGQCYHLLFVWWGEDGPINAGC